MAKKRRPMTKAATARLLTFGSMCLIVIAVFLFSLINYSASLYKLTKEKERLETEYLVLQEEAEDLKN